MPALTILIGLMLVLTGLGGYGYGYATKGVDGHVSPTALIPAAIGLLILLCGVFAIFKESLRKHLMHAALLMALLGFVASVVTTLTGALTLSPAVVSKSITAVLCLALIILGVRSFVAARRDRPEIS
jgi:drug/metabolite transporter (DMT)-like permease